MKKKIIVTICLIILIAGMLSLQACGDHETYDVVCTIFPQYDFVKQIVGDELKVKMLLPQGTDAHNYELKYSDKRAIQNSKLFVCVGGESERWVEDVKKSTDLRNVSVLKLMQHADLIPIADEHEHEHEEEGEYDDFDEHVYLSVKNSIAFVRVLQKEISRLYPEKEPTFRGNADALVNVLKALDEEYEAVKKESTEKTFFFADRYPFAYLMRDYDWVCVTPYKGCSSDLEISAADKVQFAEAYENSVAKGVFIIENGNKELANSVLRNKPGKIFELHSCQTVSKKEMQENVHYSDLMRKNLNVIKEYLL